MKKQKTKTIKKTVEEKKVKSTVPVPEVPNIKEDDEPTIEVETPRTEVPEKSRKERSDKGKGRGKKINDEDIVLNMKFTLIMLTSLIAKQINNPRVTMLDKEAENFDKAIDKLIIYYLPALKKHPIALLIAPSLEYIARVSIETAMDKSTKGKLEVPKIPTEVSLKA